MKTNSIIAIGNRKGGVAKTTSVAALASYFSSKGLHVLAVDLDSQANLTTTFLREIPEETVTRIFEKKKAPIVHVRANLDLVPADADLAAVEQILKTPDDRNILAKALLSVREQFDIIILDCPPSLSWLTINALSACDYLFVPMDTDKKAVDAVTKMAEACYQASKEVRINGVFFVRYEPRLISTAKTETLAMSRFGGIIMRSRIRKCSKIPESSIANTDVMRYAPNSNAAQDYTALAEEILNMIGLGNEEQTNKNAEAQGTNKLNAEL